MTPICIKATKRSKRKKRTLQSTENIFRKEHKTKMNVTKRFQSQRFYDDGEFGARRALLKTLIERRRPISWLWTRTVMVVRSVLGDSPTSMMQV